MARLPEEYKTTVPSGENAEEVVALIVACQLADTGEADMSLDELIDDWHELDLATEAVVVVAPDGRIAGYADVISRSYVTVSVYGYVHPDHRERGIGASIVAWGEHWTRDHIPQAPDNARVVVQHYVNAANEGMRKLLEFVGYEPVRGVYVMETELDKAPSATGLARGHLRPRLRSRPGRVGGTRGCRGRLPGLVGTSSQYLRELCARDG